MENDNQGTTTNDSGDFRLVIPYADTLIIIFGHVQYDDVKQKLISEGRADISINLSLKTAITVLEQLEVTDTREEETRIQAGNVSIDPKAAKNVPTAFGDFSKVLATLPGV